MALNFELPLEPQKELDGLLESFRVVHFQDLPMEYRRDKGAPFLSFSDGIQGYHIPLSLIYEENEVDIVNLNLEDVKIFFLTDYVAALAIHSKSRNSTPDIFLLHLHDARKSDIARLISEKREDVLQLLHEDASPSSLRVAAAIEAMPVFHSGYNTTFVVPFVWHPDLVTQQLHGEPEAAFLERIRHIRNPLEVKREIETMPDFLQQLLNSGLILKSIMLFTTFYSEADSNKKHLIEQAYQSANNQKAGADFLNAFSACEESWDVGDAILTVAQSPNAAAVLSRCTDLFRFEVDFMRSSIEQVADLLKIDRTQVGWSQTLINLRSHLNPKVFSTVVARKRAQLLKSAAAGNLDWSLFEPEDVLYGSVFRSILEVSGGENLPEEVEVFMKGFDTKVRVQRGRPDIIISDSVEAMQRDENYSHPELFNAEDYRSLVGWLHETYDDHAPNYRDFLIRQIPRDLKNSDVIWTLIRQGKKLSAIHKIRPAYDEKGQKIPKTYYSGTYYAARPLRENYGFGTAVLGISFSQVPDMERRIATCTLCNDSLELHLHRRGGISPAIVKEKDDVGETEDLIQMVFEAANDQYQAKYLSKEELRTLFERKLDPKDVLQFFKVNSSPTHQHEFSIFLQEWMGKGYILTNVFYERGTDGELDLNQTYVVLERKIS